MNDLLNLGLKIKKLREFRNLSQEYMAQQLGISQSQYSRLENGNCKVEPSQLQRIAELLETTIKDIKTFDVESKIPIVNVGKDNKGLAYFADSHCNVNHNYQIDPNLEKYYQDYVGALKENINLLKEKIKHLERENNKLKSEAGKEN